MVEEEVKGGRRVQRESDKSEASPQIQGDGGQEEGGSEQVAGFCPSTVTGKLGHPSEPHFLICKWGYNVPTS